MPTALTKETAIQLSMATAATVLVTVGSGVWFASGKLTELESHGSSISQMSKDVAYLKCREKITSTGLRNIVVSLDNLASSINTDYAVLNTKMRAQLDNIKDQIAEQC